MWSFMCRPDTQTQKRHGSITNDCNLTRAPCIYQVYNLRGCPQEPSIHRASFTHFTLVLESIHTCQGREHSRTKCRVDTSAVRSAPTQKSINQYIKSVLCTRLTPPTSRKQIVRYQVRLSFKSGVGVVSVCGHVSRHTDTKPSRFNHKRL